MTLIIGVKCRDGIVVGGDAAITYGEIEQEISTKIAIEAGQVVVALAGSVGTGQLLQARLRSFWHTTVGGDVGRARQAIASEIWSELAPAYQRAAAMATYVGEVDLEGIACEVLIALPVSGGVALLQYDEQAQSEEVTLDLPFVAIGSGTTMALPFLAFVKRVLWKDQAPDSIADGVFGVLWTLQHVITVNSGLGVGGKPSIAALEKRSDIWHAQMLGDEALGEHRQAIVAAEAALRGSRDILNPPATKAR